ncbi:hypothetical protein D3C80_1234940 [compost metagenome]
MILSERFLQGGIQPSPKIFQVSARRLERYKLLDGLAEGTVPVLVKTMSQLFCDRADTEHVNVSKISVGLGIEILVAQIATSDDGHTVVYHPQLVVHTPVLKRQVEESTHRACHHGTAAQMERIEHSDLYIRMRRQSRDGFLQVIAGGVIEQNPHTHFTVGSEE